MRAAVLLLVVPLAYGCRTPAPAGDDGGDDDDTVSIDAGPELDAPAPDGEMCGTPAECAASWEQDASDNLDAITGDPVALAAFLKDVPKGGDLHNHLNGAVYAETVMDWARADGDCVETATHKAVTSCGSGTAATPSSGAFYDEIIDAWSMRNFAGPESGHDHFFSTFGKYGSVAGIHRDESIADILTRAASENQVYVETMFNLGKNVGSLAASVWSGAVTEADLQTFYDQLMASSQFAAKLASDIAVVNYAGSGYQTELGCAGASPPPACDVQVRFIAQIARTGGNDTIFGQLVSAFEMAKTTHWLVGANLSSPEDDTSSINNYNLHMAMLDFLYQKYTANGASPLHVTLHAGELSAAYLPQGSTANTFHVRAAVEVAHAQRIGHGLDVMSETDPDGLMDEMHDRNVLVEVCLSSNDQILEISGTEHPLAQYLAHGVPVALATDDQAVSRSSMAGEYLRAVVDQHLDYRQLKRIARDSLEHAFLPGASLWTTVGTPVEACASSDTMGVGDPPDATCAAFLADSERATAQWELERRFREFERAQ